MSRYREQPIGRGLVSRGAAAIPCCALLAIAVLTSGCGTQHINIDFDNENATIIPLNPVPASVDVVEVEDNRGVPDHVIGIGQLVTRSVELRLEAPVSEVVKQTLEELLSAGSRDQTVRVSVTIDLLEARQTTDNPTAAVRAFAALRFHILEPDSLIATVPIESFAQSQRTGNLEGKIAEAVVEVLTVAAHDFADHLSEVLHGSARPEVRESPSPPRVRPFSLLVGAGFEFGNFGFGAEWQFGRARRFALLGGFGTKTFDAEPIDDFVSVAAWSLGGRGYLSDGKHRVFVQMLFGPTEWHGLLRANNGSAEFDVQSTYYGPAAGLGYKFTAHNGFTFPVGFNMIWSPHSGDIGGQITLGLGYSF